MTLVPLQNPHFNQAGSTALVVLEGQDVGGLESEKYRPFLKDPCSGSLGFLVQQPDLPEVR